MNDAQTATETNASGTRRRFVIPGAMVCLGLCCFFYWFLETHRDPPLIRLCELGRGNAVPILTADDAALCARVQSILSIPGVTAYCETEAKCGSLWGINCDGRHRHGPYHYADEVSRTVLYTYVLTRPSERPDPRQMKPDVEQRIAGCNGSTHTDGPRWQSIRGLFSAATAPPISAPELRPDPH